KCLILVPSSSSHMLTPMTVTSGFSLARLVTWGRLVMQRPHQVAQNSTMYVLSFSKPLTGVPLYHFLTSRAGAMEPGPIPAAFAAVTPKANPATMKKFRCICRMIYYDGVLGADGARLRGSANFSALGRL